MRKWTEKEIKYLKENYPHKNASDFKKLNRTINAIHSKAAKLGIRKKIHFSWGSPCRFWTRDELKKLKKLYPMGDTEVLVKIFNRTSAAIRGMANEIGIKKKCRGGHYRYWTQQEEKFLLENYHKYSIKELAGKLGRTYNSVSVKVYTMKLEKKSPKLSEIRKKMDWKGTPAPNNRGEEIAEKKFKELGWKIIDRGNSRTPFDYIIERDGVKYLVDVKYGYSGAINGSSLARMPKGGKPAFFFISKQGNTYFMPVEILDNLNAREIAKK